MVACGTAVTHLLGGKVDTVIELGGEDAKILRFVDGRHSEVQMNSTCAAGTGAFIDQALFCLFFFF